MKRLNIIAIAVLVLLCAAVAVRVRQVGDSWKWAEITLVSVNATQDGQVTLQLTTRHPSGAKYECVQYVDGACRSYSRSWNSPLSFGTTTSWHTETFSLNPEHVTVSGSFTNSELFARLKLHAGETRRIQANETLSLCDFTAGGKHYQTVYQILEANPGQ